MSVLCFVFIMGSVTDFISKYDVSPEIYRMKFPKCSIIIPSFIFYYKCCYHEYQKILLELHYYKGVFVTVPHSRNRINIPTLFLRYSLFLSPHNTDRNKENYFQLRINFSVIEQHVMNIWYNKVLKQK